MTGNEIFHLTIPVELSCHGDALLAHLQSTTAYLFKSLVHEFRISERPPAIQSTEDACNCAFLAVSMHGRLFATCWLNRKAQDIPCSQYDRLRIPLIMDSPPLLTHRKVARSRLLLSAADRLQLENLCIQSDFSTHSCQSCSE
jgi:hypothetical protein